MWSEWKKDEQEARHNFESFRELWLVYSDGNLGKKLTPIVASACYLAATIPPETELHHVSTTPLSPNQFPNIIPLSVPTGSPYLAYPSNMFSSIHSFGSASLLSSHAIPILLRECHRVLALPSSRAQNMTAGGERSPIDEYDAVDSVDHRGGTFHLTIVDPCPVSATLGPRLRDWLDHHLVFDLKRKFRCLHPVRLFPGWLAEAGLYAEGSTTTQIIFLASIANSQSLASSESGRRRDAEQMAEKEMERKTRKWSIRVEMTLHRSSRVYLAGCFGRKLGVPMFNLRGESGGERIIVYLTNAGREEHCGNMLS